MTEHKLYRHPATAAVLASRGASLAASPFRINIVQRRKRTIKIGFPVPLTGPFGTEAQDQVRAAESRSRNSTRAAG